MSSEIENTRARPTMHASAIPNDVDDCCFVCCTEDGVPTHVVCACRDRYVHPRCLVRMMNECPAHAHRCPVCHSTYDAHVERVEKRVWTLPACRDDSILDAIGIIACGYLGFAVVVIARGGGDATTTNTVGAGLLVLMGIMSCLAYMWISIRIVHPIRRRRWREMMCCLTCTREVSELTFVASPPQTPEARSDVVVHQVV